jgi:sugar lactone lactonase YvrE
LLNRRSMIRRTGAAVFAASISRGGRAAGRVTGPPDVMQVGGFGMPVGVAFGRGGSIFVSDLSANRVVRLSPGLEPKGWLGRRVGSNEATSGWQEGGSAEASTLAGALHGPHSVEFDADSRLYVTELRNRRIQVFSPDGRPLKMLPSDDQERPTAPATAFFDRNGRLLVADYGGNRILRYDRSGNLRGWLGVTADGSPGRGFRRAGRAVVSQAYGGFDRPHMVCEDGDGHLIVADTWNHRLQKFSAQGAFVGWLGWRSDGRPTGGFATDGFAVASDELGGLNTPTSISLAEDGTLIVTEYGNARVQRFGRDGMVLGWLGGGARGRPATTWSRDGRPVPGRGPGAFSEPYDAKLRDGRLFVADAGNHRLQVIAIAPSGGD